jgi:arsenite-transporting ATPase
VATLARSGIHVAELIVNRLAPPVACDRCRARRALEHESIQSLRDALPAMRTIDVNARANEPRGVRALADIGREIAHPAIPTRTHRPRPLRWHSRVSGASAGVEHLLGAPPARLLVFGGKGGVGKTTCAAAAALTIAASTRRRVLLVSTDPAHSLGDVLGEAITATPRAIRGGPPSLRVRAIDAAREFDEMRARYAAAIEQMFERLSRGGSGSIRIDASHDRRVMRGLIELAPPGIDELVAIVEVAETIQSEPDQTIVLDTAPTGHALRLLAMPAVIHEWTKALMRILLKYQPLGGIEEFGPVLVRLSRGLGELRSLLVDPKRASFIVVTRAATLPREETRDLLHHLDRLDIHVRALVVNAVGYGTCHLCRSEARAETRHLRALTQLKSRGMLPVLIAPSELPPPHGRLALARWQRRWVLAS